MTNGGRRVVDCQSKLATSLTRIGQIIENLRAFLAKNEYGNPSFVPGFEAEMNPGCVIEGWIGGSIGGPPLEYPTLSTSKFPDALLCFGNVPGIRPCTFTQVP